MPRLLVIKGADEGRQFELSGPVLGIGRDSANAIRLHDTEVSRRHAELRLTLDGAGYRIFDRKSANVPAFRRFAEDEYYQALSDWPIYRTVGLAEPETKSDDGEPARVAFRYTNGKPAMVTRKVGSASTSCV